MRQFFTIEGVSFVAHNKKDSPVFSLDVDPLELPERMISDEAFDTLAKCLGGLKAEKLCMEADDYLRDLFSRESFVQLLRDKVKLNPHIPKGTKLSELA